MWRQCHKQKYRRYITRCVKLHQQQELKRHVGISRNVMNSWDQYKPLTKWYEGQRVEEKRRASFAVILRQALLTTGIQCFLWSLLTVSFLRLICLMVLLLLEHRHTVKHQYYRNHLTHYTHTKILLFSEVQKTCVQCCWSCVLLPDLLLWFQFVLFM